MKFDLGKLAVELEEEIIRLGEEEWDGELKDTDKNIIHISQLIKCGKKRYYAFKHPEMLEKYTKKSPDALLGIQFETAMYKLFKEKYEDVVSNYEVSATFGKEYKLIGRLDIAIPSQKVFFELKKITYPIKLNVIAQRFKNEGNDEMLFYLEDLENKMKSNIVVNDEEGIMLDEIRDHYKEQLSLYKYLSGFDGHFIVEARIFGQNSTFNQRIVIINSTRVIPATDYQVINLLSEHIKALNGEDIPPRYEWNCWYGNPNQPNKCIFYDICTSKYKKPLPSEYETRL